MLRVVAYVLTALFTFLAGVAIYFSVAPASYTTIDCPLVQASAVDHNESQRPLRLGIFAGVDGVTFSTDNTRFNFFDEYKDREKAIMVSSAELSEIVHKLTAAGLLEERQTNNSLFISLPVNNTFYISWPNRTRQFSWIHDSECRVPEKYLAILEEVNVKHHDELIKNFVDYNRRNAPNHLCDSTLLHATVR